ncbi:MAG TPA: heme exporter protein CcmB [bacterium]|jgi:heme exporter protein B|nr:heme exporter protein CcmB [bacterium]HNT65921.1 heme exporter protein CcmB [bacterium]HOX86039.1 heme exporter protein CcmB [bacterium]HPG44978.1 heme exporter protein CcmB [bacterium]HPM97220.1 heme exporter protein CcmB [bacterium]
MRAIIQQMAALIGKDLRIESRGKDLLLTMTMFSLTLIVVFNFTFDAESAQAYLVAPGILWAAIAFASSTGMNRTFNREQEESCIQGLILSPIDPGTLYCAKFVSNLIFLLLCETIFLPVFWVLFDLPWRVLQPPFWLLLFFGSAGFAVVGTIFSAIAAESRAKELMLPILMLPILVPVILAAINGTQAIFESGNPTNWQPWIRLLVGFDVIFFVLAFLLYPFVVGE